VAQYSALSTVDGLEQLRRDLRALGKSAGREMDREIKTIAVKVRDHAASVTPKQTGRAAKSIKVSSTYKGVAVRSGLVYFPGIEYGAKVWLRRGLPYPKSAAGGQTSAAGGLNAAGVRRANVPVRQVPAPPGRNGQARVVNEAQYLIPRSPPIRSAANLYAPVLRDQVEQLIADLQRKYRLTA
jgi:hypothetical protein